MKNMVYIQSGGPTSVINSSLYGAIREAQKHPDEITGIYGSLNGIEGLINNNVIDLNKEDFETIELLKQACGAALGSTRFKLPKDLNDPVYAKIVKTVKDKEISYIFVNGGNDSMDTCHVLSELMTKLGLSVRVMGVPKTIDNDLAITDHSLGFGSAAKYVNNAIAQISFDARSFKNGKVHIVEIMGRDAGWLTASCDLLPEDLRPDLIYIPERKFDLEDFLKRVKKLYEEKGSVLVAVSEGIQFPRDTSKARVDGFGHIQLEGAGLELAHIVDDRLNLKTRSIELSVPQRAFTPLTSKTDQEEAIEVGRQAVLCALKGETGRMVTLKRVSNHPYKIEYESHDVGEIANAVSLIRDDMILDETRMSDVFRDYCRPLIEGEIELTYENGIVKFPRLKKVRV